LVLRQGGAHMGEVDQWEAATWQPSSLFCFLALYGICPQFTPKTVSVPKLHPEKLLIKSNTLISPF
jgi:hypothetical protein